MSEETLALVDELRAGRQDKPAWSSQVGVLAVSLLVFVSLGLFRWSPTELVTLVLVLVVHETGHYVAMRASGYRDVRMFFIPLFGAAVSGSTESAPAHTRVLVALAGPLPGIVLGALLAFVSLFTAQPLVSRAAMMLLGINAFNLLPLLPLDGGHVMEETIFCRNATLSALFRAATALAVLGLAIAARDLVFGVLGAAMLVSVPYEHQTRRIAVRLRQSGAVPLPSVLSEITPEFVQRATAEAEREFRRPMRGKLLVGLLRTIAEKVSLRPPSARATVLLLGAYTGAIVVAAIGTVPLVIGSIACPAGQFSVVDTIPSTQLTAKGCVSKGPDGVFRLEGIWEFFHPNGRKAGEGGYKNGAVGGWVAATGIPLDGREGPWVFWYANGAKAEESVYEHGNIHGPSTMWYENGRKKMEGVYRNGAPEGLVIEWYENGAKKSEATFWNGVQVPGTVKQWDEKGNALR